MDWKLKAKVFRGLAAIPFGDRIHYRLQRHLTKELPRKPQALDEILTAAQKLIDLLRQHSKVKLHQAHFLEVGAGWDLAMAIALRLLGVERITCIDISKLAKPSMIQHAAKHIANRLGKSVPALTSWESIKEFGITYRAPMLLQNAAIPSSSIDVFFSVDTLEHIPRAALLDVLLEGRRIIKPEGTSIHLIDYSDHYARGSTISRFNFLTYTEKAWIPFNSKFHYVNRMRHSEYLEKFDESGFIVIHTEPDIEQPQPKILDSLAPQFEKFNVNDLFTIRAKIIASPRL
ncbi:class I SAM-dependent methyltransferase [Eoetvoesiella caeni]|uniref:Methyltransferase family protein n=1 Tax=Eoetvoesiella caeni TaxID=645616 RepID=A0A366HI80_9BURK|nr:class I SAM-dependent methyltransferase [Eoetvoesiella caeni]MCI2807791.1 class I SAM-dependent methyltransferase [Eoetvoesiella caeni]NYT54206.1 class I SAM-dependent methyltransferase [Eoetvoesiella caeni]RBP41707.1 methyltransferase family protein [Eoetvoesiella caeni]